MKDVAVVMGLHELAPVGGPASACDLAQTPRVSDAGASATARGTGSVCVSKRCLSLLPPLRQFDDRLAQPARASARPRLTAAAADRFPWSGISRSGTTRVSVIRTSVPSISSTIAVRLANRFPRLSRPLLSVVFVVIVSHYVVTAFSRKKASLRFFASKAVPGSRATLEVPMSVLFYA